MRRALVGILELGFGTGLIAVLFERHTARVIAGGQIRRESDRVLIGLLGSHPIASVVEDVTPKAVAIDEAAAGFQHRVGSVRMTCRLFRRSDPTVIARVAG